MGSCVFLGGKIIGTAVAARIFELTESALRQVKWLARIIDWVIAKKDQIKAWGREQPAVRAARAAILRAKEVLNRRKSSWIARLFQNQLKNKRKRCVSLSTEEER